MKTKLVYKVITAHLKSAVMYKYPLSITYKRRHRIYPEIGKILAFSTLESAKSFRRNESNCENLKIFRASVKGKVKSIKKLLFSLWDYKEPFWDYKESFIKFWKGEELESLQYDIGTCPKDTVACDDLMLLDEIKL